MTFDDLLWHAELACWLICVRASPPYTGEQPLHFRIEYCLMITVPTHKHHKSPFEHSKTIYVFTSGRVIVTLQIHKSPFKHSKTIYASGRIIITLQIHSTKKKSFLKGLKWPVQNGPSIPESSRICAILLQDLLKRGVCRCEVEMLLHITPGSSAAVFSLAKFPLKMNFQMKNSKMKWSCWGFNSQKWKRKVKIAKSLYFVFNI